MTEILNLVVIFLLIVAIIYGFVLNRKIMLIHNSKKELANLFKSFDNTILKAQIGIDDLKKVSNDVSKVLQAKMDKASVLVDDLAFLNEKAAQTSAKMEKLLSEGRKAINVTPTPVNDYNAERIKTIKKQVAEKVDSIKSLKPENKNEQQAKRAKVLEGLLEKISENRVSGDENAQVKNISSAKNINLAKKPEVKNNKDENKVAEMLKAFGYGDS